MLAWIRRDEALRGWAAWLMIIAINAAVLMGLLLSYTLARKVPPSPSALTVVLWLGAAAYLAFGHVRVRGGAFQLALPLSARRIWIAHTLAVAWAGSLMAVTALAMVLLQARILGELPRLAIDVPALVAHLVAGVALAAVLLQAPRPELARVPVTWGYGLWVTLVLNGVQAVILLLYPLGLAAALLPLALAAAIAAWVVGRLPATFSLVPRESVPARSGSAARAVDGRALEPAAGGGGDSAPSRWIVARTLWLGVSGGPKDWFGYAATVLFGAVAGGGLAAAAADLVDLRYIYLPLSTLLLFSTFGSRLRRLHQLDPLPIHRRAIMALLVAPPLVVFCAGYGLGALVDHAGGPSAERVGYAQTGDNFSVIAPMSTRRIAWDGRVPATVSPWGETRAPVPWPLWRGSRAVLYSPYSAPKGSSREFVAWQLSRAAEAAYGTRLPAGEIAEQGLETRRDGLVAPKGDGGWLRERLSGLSPRSAGPAFPVLLALVCVPWLLLLTLLLRLYRADIPDGVRRAASGLVMGLMLPFAIGLMVVILTGLARPWLASALVEIPVRALGGSAAATVATWGACLALLAAAYALAQRQVRRMEIPARPVCFTLFGFGNPEA
jgi:hypothetical protein